MKASVEALRPCGQLLRSDNLGKIVERLCGRVYSLDDGAEIANAKYEILTP